MNMINLLIAEAQTKTKVTGPFTGHEGSWHVFTQTGEYKDYMLLRNVHPEFLESLAKKYKNCILVHGYGHKDEWRHDWIYIHGDGTHSSGIDFDACSASWHHVVSPKTRKPWYWGRKLTELKSELPNYATDVQEAANMRFEVKEILRELESNFNINNNYYRIQNNAALEAHGIMLTCDALIDDFEAELANDMRIQEERELGLHNDDNDY